MIGWILYRKNENDLTLDKDHAAVRLINEAKKHGVELRVFHSKDISFTLTSSTIVFHINGIQQHVPDFVMARRGAHTTSDCFTLLHALRAAGAMLVNSPESIALAQNKLLTGIHLAKHHMSIPTTLMINSYNAAEQCKKMISFPILIKNPQGTRGNSIMKIHDHQSFNDCCSMLNVSQQTFLSQEFIHASHGRDLRVLVLGSQAVACMQRTAILGNYKANIAIGGNASHYPLTPHIKKIASQAAKILNLDIAGVDLLFSSKENEYIICEVNSSPGFKGLEQANDTNIAKMIIQHILNMLQQQANSNIITHIDCKSTQEEYI